MQKYIIDAQGKRLGRVASEASALLRGKGLASFKPNALPAVQVEIVNSSKVALSEKKLSEKRYRRYSGYPGGFKETRLREFIAKKGMRELFRMTVLRMLPRNTLRSRLIKQLTVKS